MISITCYHLVFIDNHIIDFYIEQYCKFFVKLPHLSRGHDGEYQLLPIGNIYPIPQSDGHDAPRRIGEFVSSLAATIDDIMAGAEQFDDMDKRPVGSKGTRVLKLAPTRSPHHR